MVAGVVTSGALLSTVRAAADHDYRVVLVADCCADRDAEVHALLIQRVLPMTAQVVELAGWMDALPASGWSAGSQAVLPHERVGPEDLTGVEHPVV